MNKKSIKISEETFNPGRREFGKCVAANALGGVALLSQIGCSTPDKKAEVKKQPTYTDWVYPAVIKWLRTSNSYSAIWVE